MAERSRRSRVCRERSCCGSRLAAAREVVILKTARIEGDVAYDALTIGLNTYPYVRDADWYGAAVHAGVVAASTPIVRQSAPSSSARTCGSVV